jgi:hypothetical protein
MMVGWEEKARSIKTGQLGKGFLTLSGPRVIHQGQGFALLGSSHAHSSFVGTLSSARSLSLSQSQKPSTSFLSRPQCGADSWHQPFILPRSLVVVVLCLTSLPPLTRPDRELYLHVPLLLCPSFVVPPTPTRDRDGNTLDSLAQSFLATALCRH